MDIAEEVITEKEIDKYKLLIFIFNNLLKIVLI